MRSPSTVPADIDANTYYVVRDQFGDGDVLRETELRRASFDDVLDDLLTAHFNHPVAVYAFNLTEGWARDVSSAFARELQSLADINHEEPLPSLAGFMRRHAWQGRQLSFHL
jgi:hypothetical protein